MSVSISVITPSVRSAGLELVKKALLRQTFTDFEWIVNDKRYKGGYWGLNRAYNDMIRQAKGELLVSWQDYTFAEPDALSRFWNCYTSNPYSIVSGVGNKYIDETWMIKKWQDPRERSDNTSFYECFPWDVEANFCSIPKRAVYEVGGFDEKMDFEGFGFDARGVFERIDMLGEYKFYLDQANVSYSLEHDRPDGWDEHNMINKWPEYKQTQIDKKRYPVLSYLQKSSSEKETLNQK